MNQSQSLILNLPDGVVQALFVDWLTVKCLCNLDSALCNHSLRREYLALLQSGTFIYEGMPIQFLSNCKSYFTWALSRGLLCHIADFPVAMMPDLVASILENHQKVLNWVSCHDFDEENSRLFTSLLHQSLCTLSRLHIVGGDWDACLGIVLSQHCSLRRLHILNSEIILPHSFANLSVLHIHTFLICDTKLTDEAAAAMAPLLPHLTRLQFKSTRSEVITNNGLVHFAQCTKLTALGLVGLSIEDDAVITMVSACPKLLYIDISNCASLTDRSLVAIAANNPLLERLYMHSNGIFSPVGLSAIAAHSKHLDTLHCANCVSITGECIANLMQKCSNMCALYLDCAHPTHRLSEADLVSVLQHGGKLVKLCLFSPTLTYRLLSTISTHCSKVQDLGFHQAHRVDPEGLFLVAKRCTELSLVLTGKVVVSPLEMLFWKDRCPALEFSTHESDMLQYNILVELS